MSYLELLLQLKEYYANLLIVQYNGKPKAKATIELFVDLVFANMLGFQIRDAFDWRTATGAQLDIVGKWVGVDRFYSALLYDFRPWFALVDWNQSPTSLQGGFSTFENFETLQGGFLDYPNINPTQGKLKDEDYRVLIGLKIIKNNINHTAKNIDDAIWDYFDGKVYTVWDLANRQLVYNYPANLTVLMKVAHDKNVLPSTPPVSIKLQEIS